MVFELTRAIKETSMFDSYSVLISLIIMIYGIHGSYY